MLQVQVLVDNTTIGFYRAEWGLSFLVECDGLKILFDTGYSDLFICNANRLNISLDNLDYVVLSHGHNDHANGLKYLVEYFEREVSSKSKKPKLIAHPSVFDKRFNYKEVEIGVEFNDKMLQYFDVNLTNLPMRISENLFFLGEIERKVEFEELKPCGTVLRNGKKSEDFVLDDSGIVYMGKRGLILLSGCAHSGICNMIEQAKITTKCEMVETVLGGFHFFIPDDNLLNKTICYLTKAGCKRIYPCHCTDTYSKMYLAKYIDVQEMGVGSKYTFK